MIYKYFLLLVVVCATVLVPAEQSQAFSGKKDFSAIQERLEAKRQAIEDKLAAKRVSMEEKLADLRERQEKKKESIQERICDRLTGRGHSHVPPFCDDEDDVDPEPPTPVTLYDVISGDDRFNTLQSLVELAELGDELANLGVSWTLFAPTDDAFSLIPTSTVAVLVANPTTTLADVLLYHLTGTRIESGDIPDGVTPLSMLNSDTATVTKNGVVTINESTVVDFDISADNGIVHVIDTVLLPPVADEPTPTPTTTLDHVVISEVLYDLAGDGTQGSELGGDNEWVELYNPTNNQIDLQDWSIGDGSSNDIISAVPFVIDPGERIVITDAATTANFWDFSGVAVVYLGSSISGGLANSGDVVTLFDPSDAVIDSVSYDSNTEAFDPSIAGVPAGSSIARVPATTDTDTAADWMELTSPTPGS